MCLLPPGGLTSQALPRAGPAKGAQTLASTRNVPGAEQKPKQQHVLPPGGAEKGGPRGLTRGGCSSPHAHLLPTSVQRHPVSGFKLATAGVSAPQKVEKNHRSHPPPPEPQGCPSPSPSFPPDVTRGSACGLKGPSPRPQHLSIPGTYCSFQAQGPCSDPASGPPGQSGNTQDVGPGVAPGRRALGQPLSPSSCPRPASVTTSWPPGAPPPGPAAAPCLPQASPS